MNIWPYQIAQLPRKVFRDMTHTASDNEAHAPCSRRKKWVILVLVLVGVIQNVLVPMSLPFDGTNQWLALAWSGVMTSQPPLLATWAAMWAGPLFSRLPRAAFLVCLLSLSITLGVSRNNSGPLNPHDLTARTLGLLGQFSVLFLVSWSIRRRYNWRVSDALSSSPQISEDHLQFSLFNLLGWMSLVSAVLATVLWLFKDYSVPPGHDSLFAWETLSMCLVNGTISGVLSIPVVLNVALVLRDQPSARTVCWAGAGFVAQIILVIGFAMFMGVANNQTVLGIVLMLLSFHVASVAVLWAIRLLGYRMSCSPKQDF